MVVTKVFALENVFVFQGMCFEIFKYKSMHFHREVDIPYKYNWVEKYIREPRIKEVLLGI